MTPRSGRSTVTRLVEGVDREPSSREVHRHLVVPTAVFAESVHEDENALGALGEPSAQVAIALIRENDLGLASPNGGLVVHEAAASRTRWRACWTFRR